MSPAVGQAISWVLIIVGWVIVNSQSNKRETRKEVRASLLELYKHLDGIEEAAFEYHTKVGDPAVARRIKRDILQIAPRIRMAIRGRMKVLSWSPVSKFRSAVTLDNFDTAQFVPKLPTDPIFDGISAAKVDLIANLEAAFGRAYRD